MSRHRPEIDLIKKEQTVRVAGMLDADQKIEFEKLHKEREERAERERQQLEQQEKDKAAAPPPQGPAQERDLL